MKNTKKLRVIGLVATLAVVLCVGLSACKTTKRIQQGSDGDPVITPPGLELNVAIDRFATFTAKITALTDTTVTEATLKAEIVTKLTQELKDIDDLKTAQTVWDTKEARFDAFPRWPLTEANNSQYDHTKYADLPAYLAAVYPELTVDMTEEAYDTAKQAASDAFDTADQALTEAKAKVASAVYTKDFNGTNVTAEDPAHPNYDGYDGKATTKHKAGFRDVVQVEGVTTEKVDGAIAKIANKATELNSAGVGFCGTNADGTPYKDIKYGAYTDVDGNEQGLTYDLIQGAKLDGKNFPAWLAIYSTQFAMINDAGYYAIFRGVIAGTDYVLAGYNYTETNKIPNFPIGASLMDPPKNDEHPDGDYGQNYFTVELVWFKVSDGTVVTQTLDDYISGADGQPKDFLQESVLSGYQMNTKSAYEVTLFVFRNMTVDEAKSGKYTTDDGTAYHYTYKAGQFYKLNEDGTAFDGDGSADGRVDTSTVPREFRYPYPAFFVLPYAYRVGQPADGPKAPETVVWDILIDIPNGATVTELAHSQLILGKGGGLDTFDFGKVKVVYVDVDGNGNPIAGSETSELVTVTRDMIRGVDFTAAGTYDATVVIGGKSSATYAFKVYE